MACITVENLNTNGLNLFADSESFLTEVGDRDMAATVGGITPVVTFTAASWGAVSISGVTFGTGFAAGVFGAGAAGGAWYAWR